MLFTIACVATDVYTQLNNVSVKTSKNNIVVHPRNTWDVVLVGNMVCDKNQTKLLIKWLDDINNLGKVVLVGDPQSVISRMYKLLLNINYNKNTITKVFRLSTFNVCELN